MSDASLQGRTIFVSGASRGIGLAIALRAARDGANCVIAAKTAEPHRHLPGTIFTAAEAVERAGGQALPVLLDVRDDLAIERAFMQAADRFGGIDILVNSASAISRAPVTETEPKRYDLMHDINARGTFMMSRAAVPYLRRSTNPHVLTLSPPINLQPRWFGGSVAYTMSKYAMSMTVLGMAEEFGAEGIAFNALWPRYGIATAAIEFAAADAGQLRLCRTPAIMADAAHSILVRPARECSGNFFIDDTVLHAAGVRDLARYKVDPEARTLRPGLYLPDDDVAPPGAV
ncbi:SDR family oxidoreductase [Sphingomonas flavalba]|uniref:SDR family oxidoreductase n=1 Tax=Sphingomonas flavalba TaxID=2559804 RepID=UPI0039E17293